MLCKTQTWSSVGTGVNSTVYSLAVYNGELYAGGRFTMAGGVPANYIAKWDGSNWSTVGSGMDTTVYSLAVYNGVLYAGGLFTVAGGNTANYIAKRDGTTWSAVGSGTNGIVRATTEYNGDLYVGGDFTMAGGDTAHYIAKWTDTTTSMEEVEKNKLKVYPNPAFDIIKIENVAVNEISKISVSNLHGREYGVHFLDVNTIDASKFENGVYILKIQTANAVFTKRIVIRR